MQNATICHYHGYLMPQKIQPIRRLKSRWIFCGISRIVFTKVSRHSARPPALAKTSDYFSSVRFRLCEKTWNKRLTQFNFLFVKWNLTREGICQTATENSRIVNETALNLQLPQLVDDNWLVYAILLWWYILKAHRSLNLNRIRWSSNLYKFLLYFQSKLRLFVLCPLITYLYVH